MTKDSVDLVCKAHSSPSASSPYNHRSFLATTRPALASTRALYRKVVSNKYENPVPVFGDAFGQGFINAVGQI
jgi:hypothetical protein